LSKAKRFLRALGAWSNQVTSRLDLEMLEILSPIDKFVVYSGIVSKEGLFDPTYEDWRVRRINKILEIYGTEYFKGKKILELGAGHGDIGAFFADMGANVLCLDGRIQNVNFARLKHRKLLNISFEQFNLENDFSQFGKFDLIIDFGLIYHLKNVESHLNCCFHVADEVILETIVCDSIDPNKIFFCKEKSEVDEEALEGIGSRPSPFYVERVATENKFNIHRHFTTDLNSGIKFASGYRYRYDWTHKNDDSHGKNYTDKDFWKLHLRRFWRFSVSDH
jgi:SAM-dependent methyltransferase